MASLRKNEFWYIRYRDETGKQTERKASRDKSVAKSMAKSLEEDSPGSSWHTRSQGSRRNEC